MFRPASTSGLNNYLTCCFVRGTRQTFYDVRFVVIYDLIYGIVFHHKEGNNDSRRNLQLGTIFLDACRRDLFSGRYHNDAVIVSHFLHKRCGEHSCLLAYAEYNMRHL